MQRRRLLRILAATPGLALPRPGGARAAGAAPPVTWTGPALGGIGTIALHHPEEAAARRLVAHCVAELRRLEAILSLWRPDSALSELNRRGVLAAPPPELVEVLAEAGRIAALTDGRFDVTVQPLWALYRDHFAAAAADPAGPPEAAVQAALARVDHRRLLVAPDRVAMAGRGMAVTLNGIAQGYVTDRVVSLLRRAGVAQTLVDLGEARAMGTHPAGRPWHALLSDPEAPGRAWGEVDLVDRALASSGDGGFVFDTGGRFTHLLDPRSGRSPRLHRAVAVLAPAAMRADALSTGFALLPEARIDAALGSLPGVEVRLLRHDGSTAILSATAPPRGAGR